MSRVAAVALVSLLIASALSACGKKAEPEPPPGSQSTYPRTYPTR